MKLTLITSDTVNVVKQIGFTDGELVVHVPAMPAKGTAERVTCSTLHDLADVIRSLNQKQAVVWGDYRKPENSVSVVKKGEEVNGSISRSKDFFFWPEGETVFAVDYDGDEKLTAEELIARLAEVFPEFANAGCVVVPSSSGGIIKDGEVVKDSTGMRLLYLVPDGTDIARFSDALFELAWLAGFGTIKIASTGEPMRRCSVFDKAVHSPERFDFLGPPTLTDGLEQERTIRVIEGGLLDTHKLTDPTEGELLRAAKLTDEAKWFVRLDCKRQEKKYKDQRREELIAKGIDEDDAEQIVESCLSGTLLGSFWLKFDDGTGCFVRQILEDPRKYHNKTLPDPKEPDLGKNKAIVYYNRPDVVIHSNLHGGQNFVLRYDLDSLLKLIEKAKKHPKVGKLFAQSEVDAAEKEQVLAAIRQKFGGTMTALRQAVIQGRGRALTHQQMANRFIDDKGILKFVEGRIWTPDEKNIWHTLDDRLIEYEVGTMFSDQSLARTTAHYAQIRRAIQNTVSDQRFFADAPFGLAGPSGFYTVDDKGNIVREELTVDHRQKFSVPFDANLKDPEPELMLRFMNDCFDGHEPELQIARVQEFGGAALTGIAWEYETAFFFLGPGNSGKSTMSRVLTRYFPQHLIAAPSAKTINSEYTLASIAGAKLIMFPEMDYSQLGGTFKAVTGRDPVDARQPTERTFSFINTGACLGVTNGFPKLVEVGDSMMRRIEVANFPHNRKRLGLAKRNITDLDRRLVDDGAGDLVGWFLQGAARLRQQNEYTRSDTSEKLKQMMRAQSDPLTAFLEEAPALKKHPNQRVLRSKLNQYFEDWCVEQNVRKVPSRIELVALMERQGFPSVKSGGEFYYQGVTILEAVAREKEPF